MSELKTKDGAIIAVRDVSAHVYGPDSGMQGRIAHATVAVNIGLHCGTGQFSVHIAPGEARAIAAMLIDYATEAQASEMALLDRIMEAI